MDDISDLQRQKYMEDHNLSPEDMERIMWEELGNAEPVERECTETNRRVCINCSAYSLGLCKRGADICKYPDGAFMATVCMIVLLSVLLLSIFYKLIF